MLESAALKNLVIASLEDDKAQDIVAIDLAGKSTLADVMIVASGGSTRQVAAISDHLIQKLKAAGVKPRVEGLSRGDWVLIDALDAIVHVFRPEVRAFYNLEKMWQLPEAEVDPQAPSDETDPPLLAGTTRD